MKLFKTKYHFVLYDSNNDIVALFDNFNELSKHINYTMRDLLKEYKKKAIDELIINIRIGNKIYQLYAFED